MTIAALYIQTFNIAVIHLFYKRPVRVGSRYSRYVMSTDVSFGNKFDWTK